MFSEQSMQKLQLDLVLTLCYYLNTLLYIRQGGEPMKLNVRQMEPL
jgi:hypothetical protein